MTMVSSAVPSRDAAGCRLAPPGCGCFRLGIVFWARLHVSLQFSQPFRILGCRAGRSLTQVRVTEFYNNASMRTVLCRGRVFMGVT